MRDGDRPGGNGMAFRLNMDGIRGAGGDGDCDGPVGAVVCDPRSAGRCHHRAWAEGKRNASGKLPESDLMVPEGSRPC